jgi:hypothetical protein
LWCILKHNFFFFQWAIWFIHHQKHYEIFPSPSRNHIVLHSCHVKSYKCICFYTYNIYISEPGIWFFDNNSCDTQCKFGAVSNTHPVLVVTMSKSSPTLVKSTNLVGWAPKRQVFGVTIWIYVTRVLFSVLWDWKFSKIFPTY